MSLSESTFLRKLPAVATGLAVAVFSLLPMQAIEGLVSDWMFPGADKLVHAGFYFLLAGMFNLSAYPTSRINASTTLGVVVLAALYGGAIELLQPLAGRTPELADALCNLAGAAAFGTVYRIFRYYAPEPGLNLIAMDFRSARTVVDARKRLHRTDKQP